MKILMVLAILYFSCVYNIKLKGKSGNHDVLDDDFKDTIKFAENLFTEKGIIFLINLILR